MRSKLNFYLINFVNLEQKMSEQKHVIGLIGNPNCGKTTLFNALTGSHQQVGNWPGVTVERKVGRYTLGTHKVEVIDLPGLYSLDTTDGSVSLDEQVARDYVLSGQANVIVNIIDASNLERNLFLTTQLLEMDVPVVVALNMLDVAQDRGIDINIEKLQAQLGCPVFKVVASRNQGVNELKKYLAEQTTFAKPTTSPTYPPAVKQAISSIEPIIATLAQERRFHPSWTALKALEGDFTVSQMLNSQQLQNVQTLREQVETELSDDIDIVIADGRYNFISQVVGNVLKRKNQVSKTFSDKIDHIVLNRILGIPIFLFMMYLMFMFTINIGGIFNDFLGDFVGVFLISGLGHLLETVGSPEWLKTLLADGFGGGVQTVATFIPIVGALFIFLSILEDSGYMARAAFVMDRFMRFIGLPGKSFVPLIVGFGCNVPAIMATRTLESERDRKMTMAMAPFMSCGARLPIYALFVAAFFTSGGQTMVFILYLIGIAASIFTGLILKHTLLPGKGMPFIMELPPYHLPTVKGILLHSWDRLKAFVLRASKVIVPMVMVVNVLNSVGTDGTFGHQDTNESVLSSIGKTITPVFHPTGLTDENWPAAVGIFTGLLAKEAVVGTLNALYTQAGKDAAASGTGEKGAQEADSYSFWNDFKGSFNSIPEKLSDLKNTILDPVGLRALSEEDDSVDAITYSTMKTMFPSSTAAFAYLLMVLLYFPCVAVIGAIAKEAGNRWAFFVATWSTGLAYCVSTLFYQLATFSQHAAYSSCWIAGIAIFGIIVFFVMRQMGQRNQKHTPTLPGKAATV